MTDMPSAKEEVRRILEDLPDDASWEDIQYSIYVRERIERGRREADEGKVIDQEEIEKRMERWLE
jgi:predicted transcriptional regulator